MDHVNDLVALKFEAEELRKLSPKIHAGHSTKSRFPNVIWLFRGSDDHWVEVVVTELTRDVLWNARVENEDGAHDRTDLFWRATHTEYYSVSSLKMIGALVCRVNAEVPHTTKFVCIIRYTSLRCRQHS